ncbi:MAG: hypothetical protein U1G07_01930 [Verrucomicrobiota bacterium]
MNTQSFSFPPSIGKAICLLTALVAVPSAVMANTILTFQPTSGDPATGTLILGQPLNQDQFPLSGSTFTVYGTTLDLSIGFTWLGSSGRTLTGFTFDPSAFLGLEMVPNSQPAQDFLTGDDFEPFGGGSGNWVASPSSSVPEAGATLAMLGLGLAGCTGFRRIDFPRFLGFHASQPGSKGD